MLLNSILSALGYLGLFLFGLHFMSRRLACAAGSYFQEILIRLVDTSWKGFLAGFMVTGFLQSSSLTSVITVGLVNAGVINLKQAITVIIGANVGTTITAQIFSFDIQHLALPLVGIASFAYLSPMLRKSSWPAVILGFGLALLGMSGLTASLLSLKDSGVIISLLNAAAGELWKGITAGAAVSAALQSSSAVVGLVLGMSKEGIISLTSALAVLMGADLGTCITAIIASLGMSRAARATACSHLVFNSISLILGLAFFPYLLQLTIMTAGSLPRQLANFHTIYNLLGAVILLPLAPHLAVILKNRNGHVIRQ